MSEFSHKEIFDFVSLALAAQKEENEIVKEYRELYTRFIEFANEEDAMDHEADQILKMQKIGENIEMVANFQSIYGKRIGAVAGGFSAGKSSFLNGFLPPNTVKLPEAIEAKTAIPCYITCGAESISGHTPGGGKFTMTKEYFESISHDFLASLKFNLKDIIPYITLSEPLDENMFKNLCLIDTPGYNADGSGFSDKDFETSMNHVLKADFLIWMANMEDGIISGTDVKFLNRLAQEKEFDFYVVANKANLVNDKEGVFNDMKNVIKRKVDIECSGICAYNSMTNEEYMYDGVHLKDFIHEQNIASSKMYNEIENAIDEVFDAYKDAELSVKKEYDENRALLKNIDLEMMKKKGVDEDKSTDIKKLQQYFSTDKLDGYLTTIENLRKDFKKCVGKLKIKEETDKLDSSQAINSIF
ncbi:GTPase [Spirochaetia bacterium]|nr:GTPase [Spirochaetia bacterium]